MEEEDGQGQGKDGEISWATNRFLSVVWDEEEEEKI
jgi:hypothetical protein